MKQGVARFVGQRSADEKTVTEYTALKASFTKAAQAARIAFREGNKVGIAQARENMTQALNRLEWMKNRRERIKMARDYFGLTDAELKSISRKNPLLMDNLRWDTALREQNPFYDFLVTEMTREMLNSEMRYHEIESDVYDLAKASDKSRHRTLTDRAIPQDKQIMDYLEADEATKVDIAAGMTEEQLAFAAYIQNYFSKALEYLIATKALDKGRENYFVHIRRSFFENVKDEGLKSAFKNLFKNYHQDEAVFNILDDDTGNILPLEKFFQFAMMRTDELVPTANITRAFLTYARTFEKKVWQ